MKLARGRLRQDAVINQLLPKLLAKATLVVVAPHNAYPCSGDDQWCAIAVQSDEQWDALRGAIGDPDWARADRFRTAEERLRHQDEIDQRLGEWTIGKSAQDVMAILQSAGVQAGVVQRSSDLL